jgi:DNA-binding Xre family transcriptional regulator
MNLKVLVMKKGVTQLELARHLNVHPTLVSLQINKHRLLPEKYLDGFCDFLGIKKEELLAAMKAQKGAK